MDQAGQTAERFLVEIESLADFARRRAPAISDAVGGHRRAQFAVALANILNCPCALVATRQIEIDVGPFAAFLGKKSFEQQFHADRIDGSDPEGVTDRAVGRRAATLGEDVVLATKLDDVPNDQEVTFELEFFDQLQLALDLPARFFVSGHSVPARVACARAFLRALAEKGSHCLSGRYRVLGKLVAEILQAELKSC